MGEQIIFHHVLTSPEPTLYYPSRHGITYPDTTSIMNQPSDPSEAAKYRPLYEQYLGGNIVDVGSGGWPCHPRAIQIELESSSFNHYTGGRPPAFPLQWQQNDAYRNLPFKDGTVDVLFSSHLLEDFEDWWPILREWSRVLKSGGHLIVIVPDKERWRNALRLGQPPNCQHRHESRPGELSEYAAGLGVSVIRDSLTNHCNGVGKGGAVIEDYSVLFVAQKK